MRLLGTLVLLFLVACGRPDAARPANTLKLQAGCDALHECVAMGEAVRLNFHFDSPPEPLKPFIVKAHVQGEKVDRASVGFEMQGMEMGDNRYRMELVGDQWVARAVLPVCTTARADWLARVLLETDSGTWEALVPFSTQ